MELVRLESKKIVGLTTRTQNANEMNPETSKIAGLWQSFFENVAPLLPTGSPFYGVYYNYESDASGEFTVLAGTDQSIENSPLALEEITLESGDYLLFKGQGEMPQTIIDTWAEIWTYFTENPNHQRRYTTDFECYTAENEVEIYIAIQ